MNENHPLVRLTATLAGCADHKLWDGMRLGTFVGEVARLLQDDGPMFEMPPAG